MFLKSWCHYLLSQNTIFYLFLQDIVFVFHNKHRQLYFLTPLHTNRRCFFPFAHWPPPSASSLSLPPIKIVAGTFIYFFLRLIFFASSCGFFFRFHEKSRITDYLEFLFGSPSIMYLYSEVKGTTQACRTRKKKEYIILYEDER